MMENFVFCQNSLMVSSFGEFEDMRGKGELIDFRLAFADRTFEGHRIVLAAAIPYFREVFSSKRGEIALDGVDPDALEAVIKFAYKGKIEISYENVRSLISATGFFRLDDVYDCCCKFLEDQIHPNNVWEIRAFAETQNFPQIMSISDQYIKQNFEAFSESPDFENVPFGYLKEIISKDDLKVKTEEKVFEAVLRWVKFSPTERRDHLRDLLLSVRMSQLCFDYLEEQALPNALIQTIECCKKLVEEAKYCYLIPETISRCSFNTRPRTLEVQKYSVKDEFGLYAVCDSESGISVKFLKMDDQMWTAVSQAEIKHLHKVAVFGGRIYVFLENTVKCFNVKTLSWRSMGTFHESLFRSAVVCHRKNIYFFGGPHKGSNIIRCYSHSKNDWLEEDQMNRCIDFPGAASLGDFIYVTGGCFERKAYKTVDRYNPETKKWEEVASMLSRRYSHASTSLNGKIYVCGGSNDTTYLNTVEEYDPQTNHWKFVGSMRVPRTAFSVVPFDGKIYAVGGTTERGTDPAGMEVYDPCYDRWKSGVALSNSVKCEIYLVKAKVPAKTDQKVASVESLTSISSHVSTSRKNHVIPVCFYCRKPGHVSRDCWHKLCYNCGKPGHPAAECTQKIKNDMKCSQCGKTGHCQHDRPSFKLKDSKCYACGCVGHFSRDCPSFDNSRRSCFSCGGVGHIQDDCSKCKKR